MVDFLDFYVAFPHEAEALGARASGPSAWTHLRLDQVGIAELVLLWGILKPEPAPGRHRPLVAVGANVVTRIRSEVVSAVGALSQAQLAEMSQRWREELDNWDSATSWPPVSALAQALGSLYSMAQLARERSQALFQVYTREAWEAHLAFVQDFNVLDW